MTISNHTPELLAPAGGLEQLRYALHYGADAVYVGGERFGLRVRAQKFGIDELAEAVQLTHAAGKKLFVTANAIMHNADLEPLTAYARELNTLGIDAVIVSDPGAVQIFKEHAPAVDIHISTQASCANAESAKFWRNLGATRVVLARELSIHEVAQIKREVGKTLELEVFAHGAMCMAYSGRCLISNYLTGRDANRGHCTQPCRWGYSLVEGSYALTEETRPGQEFSLEEDNRGTYLMNSKDLMMLDHLDELRETGVDSIKVEGRMKGSYYVATVINAYRQVLDGAPASDFMAEMDAVSHRPYGTGFFFGEAQQTQQNAEYQQTHDLVADIVSYEDGRVTFNLRNRIFEGDAIEVLTPGQPIRSFVATEIQDEWGIPTNLANNAMGVYSMAVPFELQPLDLLRKKRVHAIRPER